MKNEYVFANEILKDAVKIAKKHKLKVWTFKNQRKVIEQVFFDDGIIYGTASISFGSGLLDYGTCHAPNRQCGAGFRTYSDVGAHISYIKNTLVWAPEWAHGLAQRFKILKLSFEKEKSKDKNLKYFEL